MRENEPVLLVPSVCGGEIILEKGEILSEKRHFHPTLTIGRLRRGIDEIEVPGCPVEERNSLPILKECARRT